MSQQNYQETVLPLGYYHHHRPMFQSLWPSAVEFFFWWGAHLDRKKNEINSEISIWISPPHYKKIIHVPKRTKDRHPRPDQFARLDRYATQPHKRRVYGTVGSRQVLVHCYNGTRPFRADLPSVLWLYAPCKSG
jgi:hypothetical protein